MDCLFNVFQLTDVFFFSNFCILYSRCEPFNSFLVIEKHSHIVYDYSGEKMYRVSIKTEQYSFLAPSPQNMFNYVTWQGLIYVRSSKLRISLHSEKGSEAIIDLEALSGFTEFFLEIQDNIVPHRMAAFGLSLQPVMYNLLVPSQVVLIVPRYVVSNESGDAIAVRQCFVEVCHFFSNMYWYIH